VKRALLVAAAVTAAVLAVPYAAARGGVRHPGGPPATEPALVAPTGIGDTGHLTPALRRAMARAIDAARADGVDLVVTSGWRSAAHQQRLYEDAIAKYGSPAAARRWVLPPEESAHVRGEAVDVGPPAGARWLETHGVRYGLCRRYANEPWHFERLAAALGSRCPPLEPHA
jgi:D-alanyl-D-alanine carboxypeptidase